MGGVVGEEENLLPVRAQILDETNGKRKDLCAELNGAVHVENEQLLALQNRNIGIDEFHETLLHYVLFLSYHNPPRLSTRAGKNEELSLFSAHLRGDAQKPESHCRFRIPFHCNKIRMKSDLIIRKADSDLNPDG